VGRYAQHATAEQFVDAVIAGMQSASGVDVSGRRAQLLAVYNGGVDVNDSRAAVMREAIDDAQFMQAEFNRAFVLMQYFGYLRRDPDQGGYDFWLDILTTVNQTTIALWSARLLLQRNINSGSQRR